MVTMKQQQHNEAISNIKVKAKEFFPKSYDYTIHETQEVDSGNNKTEYIKNSKELTADKETHINKIYKKSRINRNYSNIIKNAYDLNRDKQLPYEPLILPKLRAEILKNIYQRINNR